MTTTMIPAKVYVEDVNTRDPQVGISLIVNLGSTRRVKVNFSSDKIYIK